MQSLCTLRNHCRQWPRNTRYQADATPYLGRTSTGWIAPALPGALTRSPRRHGRAASAARRGRAPSRKEMPQARRGVAPVANAAPLPVLHSERPSLLHQNHKPIGGNHRVQPVVRRPDGGAEIADVGPAIDGSIAIEDFLPAGVGNGECILLDDISVRERGVVEARER